MTLTRSNTTCFMMSYSRDSALEIFDKLRTIYDYLPDYVKLTETTNNKSALAFDNNSKIIVATCGTKDKVRGSTLAFAHLSEVGLMN
ncbi:hypothetical protein IMSAGC019_03079 [Lachnospiraceae bacterium]|nr:hypothetical protein IMSAGC019_03079 [Lachnospiraceae bacterium]